MGPEVTVPLGFFGTVIIIVIGLPLARAFSRRVDLEAKNPRIPSEMGARLERIEQAIETVAIEVERISEGQRFTTRLLSEGKSASEAHQGAAIAAPARDRST
jgi:Na+/glutamate symporter